jgi:hypothetical protein
MLLVAWASRITNRDNEKIKTMKAEREIKRFKHLTTKFDVYM